MCIAIPMQVESVVPPLSAVCVSEGRRETVNTELTGPLTEGEWVLVFRGQSVRRVSEEEARKMFTALTALNDVMGGEATEDEVNDAFADITAHTGELPPHLAALVKKSS